jgi:hypothetical protein
MSVARRQEHLVGFITGVWSYAKMMQAFLLKVNTKHSLRCILSDRGVATSPEVFASDLSREGDVVLVPPNTAIDPSSIFAEESYVCKCSALVCVR